MSAPSTPAAGSTNRRAAAFVARCTGSAMLSSMAAGALGLGHPIWAVVSALVVSQDSAVDTRQAFVWRVAATAIGLLVAVAVGSLIPDPARDRPLQLAIAVTICAVIARRWPLLRVSMWTAPIVLMTTVPETGLVRAAAERGSEVLLGAMIATVLHLALDRALHIRSGRRHGHATPDTSPSPSFPRRFRLPVGR